MWRGFSRGVRRVRKTPRLPSCAGCVTDVRQSLLRLKNDRILRFFDLILRLFVNLNKLTLRLEKTDTKKDSLTFCRLPLLAAASVSADARWPGREAGERVLVAGVRIRAFRLGQAARVAAACWLAGGRRRWLFPPVVCLGVGVRRVVPAYILTIGIERFF